MHSTLPLTKHRSGHKSSLKIREKAERNIYKYQAGYDTIKQCLQNPMRRQQEIQKTWERT